MKKYILILLFSILILPVFAFEDCVISTNGKLTDIKIQNNDIIDVYPLITIMNDKNTLFVHPLKAGCTKFTVLKNGKDKYLFNVKVSDNSTQIDEVKGFDILTIDCPPNTYEYYFDLDEPPANSADDFINNLDEPPALRGEK